MEPTKFPFIVGFHLSCLEPHTAAANVDEHPFLPRAWMINSVLMAGPRQRVLSKPTELQSPGVERKNNTRTYMAPRIRTKCLLLLKSQNPFYFVYLYRKFAEVCSIQKLKVHWSDR